MEVAETTATTVLSGQSPGECSIFEIAETATESFQYLKIGATKYKLASFVDGFMTQTELDK
jgi:hypothetical protein